MAYDAIIFDLDGTAMAPDRHALPSTAMSQTTKKYRDLIKLCAATGRSWQHAKPVIDKLGLNQPCIIAGGAMIIDPVSEKIVWQETIDVATAKKIVDIAKGYPYNVSISYNLNLTGAMLPQDAIVTEPVNTIYIFDMPRDAQLHDFLAQLEALDGITVSKALSWDVKNGTDWHITPSSATKEHAVIELCDRVGADRLNVAGVGDGLNDIHLFNAVGHKIAMGNAATELKEMSDIVIGSFDQDGLADFIKKSVES